VGNSHFAHTPDYLFSDIILDAQMYTITSDYSHKNLLSIRQSLIQKDQHTKKI